jgi:uncharacterized protein
LKEQVRVCGIDDAPFEFGNRDARATVIGAVVRAPSYLEGVLRFDVAVDGNDATPLIAKALSQSRFEEQIRAVMIDGVCLAGFNVIDIKELNREVGIPVVTVTRDRPDMGSIESALSKHFEDWKERLRMISELPQLEIETGNNPIFVSYAGISEGEVESLIKATTVKGTIPEPIRMAHIIASGVTRGESKGKA